MNSAYWYDFFQWARSLFEELFSRRVHTAKEYIQDRESFVHRLSTLGDYEKVRIIDHV